MVDRYEPHDGWLGMDLYARGEWVKYDDYKSQSARIEQLEAQLSTSRNDALREAADACYDHIARNDVYARSRRDAACCIISLITKDMQ